MNVEVARVTVDETDALAAVQQNVGEEICRWTCISPIQKTLYISDLDGTLLNRNAELSEYTIDTLNKLIANGVHFSVATARTLASAGKILHGLELRLPIVLMNGVLIYDVGQQRYLQVCTIPRETVAAVIKMLRKFEVTGFMYELNNGELMTYHESLEKKPLRDFVEERISRYYKTFRHTEGFDCISPDNIIYFTLRDTREHLQPVLDALTGQPGQNHTFYSDTYSHGLWYLEIYNEAASKYNAVQFLRQQYVFHRVVGFGDNLNDLPLFAACDESYAVRGAKPEVKEKSTAVIGGNDDDGVVKWIEENA